MTIPSTLYAGDTLLFSYSVDNYSSDDGFGAVFLLNSSTNKYTITGAGVGTTFTFSETSANTANYAPGKYTYLIYSTKAGEQYTVERGEIEVKANLVAGAGTDIRTHAQIVLDNICAVLEARSTQDQRDYQLAGGVSISKMDHTELLEFKRQYEVLRRQEIKDEDRKNGKTAGNIIKVRFV